jgi:hypothetical protein
MVERLGNVLYWLGLVLAAICVASGVAVTIFLVSENPKSPQDAVFLLIPFFSCALIFFLIGRAFRYVLTGR